MILSRSGEYALLALLYLASQPADVPVRVSEIAESLDVPANYLSKLLHRLARGGVLRSVRGPHGGFVLATAPDEICLADALRPIEAGRLEPRCLLGRPECRDDDPCAAHDEWQSLSQHIDSFLAETTLSSLRTSQSPRKRSSRAHTKKKATKTRRAR